MASCGTGKSQILRRNISSSFVLYGVPNTQGLAVKMTCWVLKKLSVLKAYISLGNKKEIKKSGYRSPKGMITHRWILKVFNSPQRLNLMFRFGKVWWTRTTLDIKLYSSTRGVWGFASNSRRVKDISLYFAIFLPNITTIVPQPHTLRHQAVCNVISLQTCSCIILKTVNFKNHSSCLLWWRRKNRIGLFGAY